METVAIEQNNKMINLEVGDPVFCSEVLFSGFIEEIYSEEEILVIGDDGVEGWFSADQLEF